MHDELDILLKLSTCLVAALVGGFITQRMGLSPIVGYLVAGIAVGPQTPGFVADQASAAQFAEIGIILLMFGVGLHFNLDDLLAVRRVALPGALGQVVAGTLLGSIVTVAAGWSWSAGVVMGIAVSVASTVVLTRVLDDNGVLASEQGHVAVGWLIVQDVVTVLVLVMVPAVASALRPGNAKAAILPSLIVSMVKIAVLVFIVLWGGKKALPRLLEHVARTRTRELFTLAVLAVALSVATLSAWLFGVSMALGAFLAGMVVGQSAVSHQAAADALPMRDAFAVLFFVSVGMLFDPMTSWRNAPLVVGLLAVILLANPLVAFFLAWWLRSSLRTALTVAVGIAQIGEFSFILAALAGEHALLPAEAQSLLVACSIAAISLNPLLFRRIQPLEAWLRRQPRLWRLLSDRSESRLRRTLPRSTASPPDGAERPRALIVGYGPVGQTACSILRDCGVDTVVIDLNIDTVSRLTAQGQAAVFGDATRREILEAAGIASARYLLVTTPEAHTRTVIVIVAREINPDLKTFVRARYLGERAWLEEIGATEVCFEEVEAAIGLAAQLLREMGADEERLQLELDRTRTRLARLRS